MYSARGDRRMKRVVSAILLVILLTSMLYSAFKIMPAEAAETIYIRADGSIDPPTAPINTADNVTYTFTGNINDSIVIERDNIVVDGAGWEVQGAETTWDSGIDLTGRSNVTIQGMTIKAFGSAITLHESSNIRILRNKITANKAHGIVVGWSLNNTISENSITNQGAGNGGILLGWSSGNTIYKNDIMANAYIGIWLSPSSDNIIYENNLTANEIGIDFGESSNNIIYHNNFVNNVRQVHDASWDSPDIWDPSINTWDGGFPSGGNYWSDYNGTDSHSGSYQNETGSDGIGDTPYNIDVDNRDNYPLMNPWPSGWKLDFAGPTNHPVVDFAVFNGSLYAAADKLYVYNGSSWNVLDAPTYITSLETMDTISSISMTYGGIGLEETNCLIQTSDGGYVMAGQNSTGGRWDFQWVKTDATGAVQWNHSYGTSLDDHAYSAVQTTDGGYALAGDFKAGEGDGDFWLIRADTNGNTLWNKTYGTPNYQGATSIVQTPDGGFALSGWTDSPMGNPNAWLVKTDENGSLQWDRIYGGDYPYYDGSNSMILTADGGYALAGQSQSYGAGYDFWLVKTGSSGNMQWNKKYGGMNNDNASSIIATNDGGYALVGSTASFGAGSADFWLVKTDAEGNMEWNKTYGGMDVDQGHSLIQTIDGGYLLAGYTRSFGAGNGDAWLVKTDTNGNVEWNQTYGGTGDDRARSLIETRDGEYAFAGYTWSSGSGASDSWLVKITTKPYLFCGGLRALYCYDSVDFTKILDVPMYIKVLGAYDNTLYAGTMLDNPPKLYYCNGLAENPAEWHVDTGFSDVLNFSGAFGSIDSFAVYGNVICVGSGGTLYSFNGTQWSTAKSYDDVCAFLDMQVYNGKLYLATRDQGWRKPLYQGGTGFSGRVIEYDGENWTSVLDHDYWVYSLEVYDGKLYAGTANKILTYNGTSWVTSFNATEGAYYTISMITYDDKVYAGMGNGYIFADPAPPKAEHKTIIVPKFPSTTILAVFMASTMLAVALTRKNRSRRFS